jgi:hypothetical protein
VPYSDSPCPQEPQRAYTLFSSDQPKSQSGDGQKRFYVGGNIYTDWATVPQTYKGYDNQHPDPARSTASIFTFRW